MALSRYGNPTCCCASRWDTGYEIFVSNPEHRCRGIAAAELDGNPVDPAAIPLVDDGATHQVRVVVGERAQSKRTASRSRISEEKEVSDGWGGTT